VKPLFIDSEETLAKKKDKHWKTIDAVMDYLSETWDMNKKLL
jgi:hypothetical protein